MNCSSRHISTGTLSSGTGDLLLAHKLRRMLEECAKAYDLVAVDSPRILAVSGRERPFQSADKVFLVELDECLKRMERSGANVTGVILNGSMPNTGAYGYAAGYGL
jgi:tyrosine-protein kinase Etk/Wzc